jgi:hypothetical protein
MVLMLTADHGPAVSGYVALLFYTDCFVDWDTVR